MMLPMPIASNTSPILNLSIIGKLDLLQKQFDEVKIPPAVLDELKLDSKFPGGDQIQQAIDQGWLEVVQFRNNEVAQVLARELDLGEAEAIALALEIDSHMILMDEHEGRQIAKSLGLSPIGVLGVFLHEKKDNNSFSVTQEMDNLRQQAGFFIAEKLYHRVIDLAGE
jgi:predicted nucleic acid-binding protein